MNYIKYIDTFGMLYIIKNHYTISVDLINFKINVININYYSICEQIYCNEDIINYLEYKFK